MAENNNRGNTVVIFTGQYIDIARYYYMTGRAIYSGIKIEGDSFGPTAEGQLVPMLCHR